MTHQLEIWDNYYHNMNMRHLFVELPYFSAEFLNIWMQSESDDILYEFYEDLRGTQAHVPFILEFYKTIKRDYPETIFHGTDVGHQHATTGARFLRYLEENNLQSTEQYFLTRENIEQGIRHQNSPSHESRVNAKAENFIRAFDSLADQNVMGIYGGAHADFGDYGNQFGLPHIPTLASRLQERYGNTVFSENLTWLALIVAPIRIETITVNDTEYVASYFGAEDFDIIAWDERLIRREFWRLENAYDNFKNNPTTGDWLPVERYPMPVEAGQVFVIDYTRYDGSVRRMFYRADGNERQGLTITEEFTP
jgi:hypothetical protein